MKLIELIKDYFRFIDLPFDLNDEFEKEMLAELTSRPD